MTDYLEKAKDRLANGLISPEDYDQIASRLNEEARDTELAAQQYGGSAAASLGTQPSLVPSKNPAAEAWDRVRGRVQKGDGGQDSGFKRDFAAGIGQRIAEAADAAVRNPSYRSFNRPGTPDDRKISDDRARRAGGR